MMSRNSPRARTTALGVLIFLLAGALALVPLDHIAPSVAVRLFVAAALALVVTAIVLAGIRSRPPTARTEPTDHLERLVEERTAELQRSNDDLERFAMAASHDLNEPLRAISGFADILATRYKGQLGEEGDECIDRISVGVDRMQELIDRLLAFAHVSSRGAGFEAIDPAVCVREAEDALSEMISETGAEIMLADLPIVRADRSQLSQVFQNLFSNAIKFSGEGEKPKILVGATTDAQTATFTVTDAGIGLAQEDAGRAFEIFGRLHGRGDYPGAGMGLAICQRIVERHGGAMWVESAVGEGARFSFTIPLADESVGRPNA